MRLVALMLVLIIYPSFLDKKNSPEGGISENLKIFSSRSVKIRTEQPNY